MADFQRTVRMAPRTQAEIDAEKSDAVRRQGLEAFVAATKYPGGGAFGYQVMLECLFSTFNLDHGAAAVTATTLEALKPVLKKHHDLAGLRAQLDAVIKDIESSR